LSGPTVSIVVPTFRRRSLLGRMIESVRAQTFTDWELIIVDGGSCDGTVELVRDFQWELGTKLVFIDQPNEGCCVARNTGIEAARGGFVAFLDSDDEFLPDKLARQMELFRLRPDVGLVYCDYSFIDLEGRFHRSTFDALTPLAREVPFETAGPGLHVCTEDFFEYLIRGYFVATIVGLVRREVLADDIRFLARDMYGCEWLFYLEIARRCRVGYVDEPLCVHHHLSGSISRSSAVRNSVYHRSLLRLMRRRFSDASARARADLARQYAETCLQLGFDSERYGEFGPAVRYFGESLGAGFDWPAARGLAGSVVGWLATLGRPGREPMLRVDPHALRGT